MTWTPLCGSDATLVCFGSLTSYCTACVLHAVHAGGASGDLATSLLNPRLSLPLHCIQGLLVDEDEFAAYVAGPGTVEWLMGLLTATSAGAGRQARPKGAAAAAEHLLISGGTAAAGGALAELTNYNGGSGRWQPVMQQLLLGPPYPEDFDTVVLSWGLDLHPTVAGMAATASSAPAVGEGGFLLPLWGQAEEQQLSCCCLSAQLLGLLASQESAAREEENAVIGGGGDGLRFRSIRSAGDSRGAVGAAERSSSSSAAGSVRLAACLLHATCTLLTSDTGGRQRQGDDGAMSAAMAGVRRRRMAAAREAAVACNAALQGLGIGALAEVTRGGQQGRRVGGRSRAQYFRL